MTKKDKDYYRTRNRLIGDFLDAKAVRMGIDVNIYIGDEKQLKMGCWTANQAWQEYTNPKITNFNNSFAKLLPAFFKIVELRGKDHSVSQELVDMLLSKGLDNFYNIIIDYIMADKAGFNF